jgi:ubiquinone/menaquinone biosynthesis C-methylase UbiE
LASKTGIPAFSPGKNTRSVPILTESSSGQEHPECTDEAGRVVRFLEAQTHKRDQRHVNHHLVRALKLQPGQRWLEVGSGSGALCRMAALCLLPDGRLVGVDIDRGIVAISRGLLNTVTRLNCLDVLPADGQELPFSTGSFDGAFAARLLLNSDHPDEVLQEMFRVVRPEGRVLAMDWDFETFVVDHSQKELTRRILLWRADNYGSNSWSGRQLFARFRSAGLERVRLKTVVTAGYSEEDALPDALRRAAAAALTAGALSKDEHDGWVGEIQRRLAAKTFFASIIYYIACGIVPAR